MRLIGVFDAEFVSPGSWLTTRDDPAHARQRLGGHPVRRVPVFTVGIGARQEAQCRAARVRGEYFATEGVGGWVDPEGTAEHGSASEAFVDPVGPCADDWDGGDQFTFVARQRDRVVLCFGHEHTVGHLVLSDAGQMQIACVIDGGTGLATNATASAFNDRPCAAASPTTVVP